MSRNLKKNNERKKEENENETNDEPIQIESSEIREVNNENDKWMKCAY